MERDPFILTGLMWAWFEQLKEPVISIQDVKALNPDNTDPQTVLNTLDPVRCYSVPICVWKNSNNTMICLNNKSLFFIVNSSQAQKETLTCILNCMAHMATIPEEVENAFLSRTIKALTWVRKPIYLIICKLQFSKIYFIWTRDSCLPLNRWTSTKKMRAKCPLPRS